MSAARRLVVEEVEIGCALTFGEKGDVDSGEAPVGLGAEIAEVHSSGFGECGSVGGVGEGIEILVARDAQIDSAVGHGAYLFLVKQHPYAIAQVQFAVGDVEVVVSGRTHIGRDACRRLS